MTNQKAKNDPNKSNAKTLSLKKQFVRIGLVVVISFSVVIVLHKLGIFATISLYLSQWWTSLSPKTIESVLSIVTGIFFGVITNAIWDFIKSVFSWLMSRNSNHSKDKTDKKSENPKQEQKPVINNDFVITGDNNVISIVQIIINAHDIIEKSLGTSPATTQKVVDFLNEFTREKSNTDNSAQTISLDDYRLALQAVENSSQENEFAQIMEELSSLLNPIIHNYRKYQREYDFPYASFCGDFVEAIKSSRNIRNSFTTIPLTTTVISGGPSNHHGRNTAIHLKVLSRFLPFSRHFGDYYLTGEDESYGLSHRFDKMWLCVLGKLRWQKRRTKAKRVKNGSWSIEAKLERLEFSDRHILIYDRYHRYDDFNFPYPYELDWEKFSIFVTGLVADFILISSGVVKHDTEFSGKMNDLFSKLVKYKRTPSDR